MKLSLAVSWLLSVSAMMAACGESRVAECTTCGSPGVGDSCVPEIVPEGGFDPANDIYLETASVGCLTLVCAVDEFTGDPRRSSEDCEADGGGVFECAAFASQATIDERVYCTCRCSDPDIDPDSLCTCGAGFECVNPFEGTSFESGYCLRAGIER